jgi:short-subunit dehydrogenase
MEGKGVALVTGASSGIGAEIARQLARQGFDVILAARREDRLKKLSEEIAAMGRVGLPCVVDVTKDGDIERAVELARNRWGKLDIVVANAGFGVVGSVEKLTLEDYRRQFETNVFGVLRTVIGSLPALKESKGRLALIGSVNGYIALPASSAYGMSKFAVRALADSLYLEAKPFGVSVTHIAPGFVKSEIRNVDNRGSWHESTSTDAPSWIMMDTEPAAREIVRAILKRKRERVITGHGKLAVFIQRHFPSLLMSLVQLLGIKKRTEPG